MDKEQEYALEIIRVTEEEKRETALQVVEAKGDTEMVAKKIDHELAPTPSKTG